MTDRKLVQMALDAIETIPEDVEGYLPESITDAVIALRAALAQPEPEPVAWMYDWYDETEDIDGVPVGGIINDWISKDYDEAHSPTMGCHNIRPLYTAPPQHQWVGLTDEERNEICLGDESIARAVEAKLKEKNT